MHGAAKIIQNVVFLRQLPTEPKIDNLNFEFLANEYVLKFDIAVHDVVGVEVGDCLDQLLVDEFCDVLGNCLQVLCFYVFR